jgi:uncharacterized SAM-binding protein YcdF (DUF218 family)
MTDEIDTQKSFTVDLNLEKFIDSKREIAERIFTDPIYRNNLLRRLLVMAKDQHAERADYAVVLGTSPKFIDKFIKRIYWASMLVANGKAGKIIFTGKTDHQTGDFNQAEFASNIAITKFGVPAELVLTGGGDNTQENLQEACKYIHQGQSIFLVTTPRHLIRSVSVAKFLMPEINVFPSAIGGDQKLDSNGPYVVNELIKATCYNHTLYRVDEKFNNPQVKDYLKKRIDALVSDYHIRMESVGLKGEPAEMAFNVWFNNLDQEYKISLAANI